MKKFEVCVITVYNVNAENKEDAIVTIKEDGVDNLKIARSYVGRADEVMEFTYD
jgi:hypothetical protein